MGETVAETVDGRQWRDLFPSLPTTIDYRSVFDVQSRQGVPKIDDRLTVGSRCSRPNYFRSISKGWKKKKEKGKHETLTTREVYLEVLVRPETRRNNLWLSTSGVICQGTVPPPRPAPLRSTPSSPKPHPTRRVTGHRVHVGAYTDLRRLSQSTSQTLCESERPTKTPSVAHPNLHEHSRSVVSNWLRGTLLYSVVKVLSPYFGFRIWPRT